MDKPDATASLVEVVAEGAADVIPESDLKPTNESKSADQPYFQFTGDENWDNSEEDEEDAEDTVAGDGQAEAEEEDDDFVNAFEVLDLARILFLRKLEQMQQSALESADKGKYIPSIDLTPEVREVKDRIADVHDLQAEISLEGEKFPNAVVDLKAALALKEEMYPVESRVLAECHYKLSLALEFSSVTQQHDADGNPVGDATVDEGMRNEAAEQMKKAIQSCKLRIVKEEEDLQKLKADDVKSEKSRRNIEDVQEMVVDMEQRLLDLRKPAVSVREAGSRLDAESNPLSGILGQILGESQEEQKKMLAEAAKGATDLSGLVKRKKPKADGESGASTPAPAPASSANANGKRKVGFADEVEEIGTGKRARVEDADDAD